MSVDQKYRAEKLRREIAAMESAAATKPQPKPQPTKPSATVKTCWDDPAFTDRVLAKAERHQTILAEIRNRPKAFVSAKDQLDELVALLMETKNVDRSGAVRLARKSRPDLFESMKIEANPHLQSSRWRR